MDKEVSCTLMIASLFCTILIISIHYSSKGEIDVSAGFSLNYYVQEIITNGFARVAVPYFALTSGFFYFQKLEQKIKYRNLLIEKIQSILIPYILASILILVSYDMLKYVTSGSFESINNIKSFVFKTTIRPISGQFWFLRDLFILFIITPVFSIVNKNIRVVVVFGCFCIWLTDTHPFPLIGEWYLINSEVLFFFLLGGIVFTPKLFKQIIPIAQKKIIHIFVIWIVFIIIRVLLDPTLDVWYVKKYTTSSVILYKLSILVGIVAVLGLSRFFVSCKLLIRFSGLTFFVYLFHLRPFASVLYAISNNNEYSFYIFFPVATMVTFLIAYYLFLYAIPVYNFLTGGRNPDKMLRRVQKG